ncbi:M16 family metallopeptidase [Mesoterricola silvestris]|uniref:Peptidase M16 n=1 Tax=Mesoterricola silvestris TaxID=2927979 RepID=A0AA48GK57_9BACT|nr:pitrilysin family protein [Mesoterricola silvestris]BDU74516.1 peptidase M16 [Mesoterricola silvestris]
MARATILALLAGGALLAQALPPRPEQIAFRPLAFEAPRAAAFKARLKNGIPVYISAEPKGVPFVRLKVLIRGGAYLEPRGKEGLAALTGMQMRAGGTEKTPAAALDERLEFLAGDISSSLGETSGSVGMEFMEKDLQEGLDLFMQVLTRPAFAQDRLDRAKENVMQGMLARNDKVEGIAGGEMNRLLNGEDHFTSAQVTGASLKAITREDLAAFHARLLHPDNLVISVSGRFKKEAMLDLLNRTLGALKPGPAAKASPKVPAPAFQRKPGIYVIDKDVPQSLVRFALPGLRRSDPDWFAALLLNQVLGGSGFTSRLMKKIRSDEGLTYGVGTGFGDGAHWKGNWSGSMQTKNRSVAYALRLALAEIERIKAEPVPAEELAVIKDGIIQAFPAQWGRKAGVVNAFAQEKLTGWPEDWWADYREKIQAVTPGELQRAAKKYLDPGQLVILVVGKASEAEAGDVKDHPGALKDIAPLPLIRLPLRDPLTLKPLS